MYLRAIRCHTRSGVCASETGAIYYELLPIISAYEGFKGASLMVNEATRTTIAFIYWDTEQHAEEAGTALRPLLFEHTCDVADSALDITGYQVLHHSMKADEQ